MKQTNVKDRVFEIVVQQLSVADKDVTEQSEFVELGADSLDIVEMILECEEAFNININEDEASKIVNVSNLITLIESKTEN